MYRTILVPLDGSAFGEHALPLALTIARRSSASVQLVHVYQHETYLADESSVIVLPGIGREQASSYLTELATFLSPRWNVPISVAVLDGSAADELCTHALSADADLVVMTTHGYGPLSRMWMGSVADKLVRRLPMPVVLIRPHEDAFDLRAQLHDQVCTHILIPLDGSPLAEEILEPALALGAPMGARYTLLQAINPPVLGYAPAAYAVGLDDQMLEQWRTEAQAYLDDTAARLHGLGHQVDTQIRIGPPPFTILDYARDHAIDLIALATHGRSGLTRMLLGSVADKIVRGAGVPVLLQRPSAERADQPKVHEDILEAVQH